MKYFTASQAYQISTKVSAHTKRRFSKRLKQIVKAGHSHATFTISEYQNNYMVIIDWLTSLGFECEIKNNICYIKWEEISNE